MLHCYVIRLQINECNYDLHNILMIGRYLTWEIKKPNKISKGTLQFYGRYLLNLRFVS